MSGDDPPPPPPKIEPTSPYYIGYHDRPGDHITGTRLNLHNFTEWKNDVRNALKARRKFVFLDGSITAPQSPCTKDDWETLHAMLLSWLMNLIEPEVKRMLSTYTNAKRLWDDLHDRFDMVDGSKIQQIKGDLRDCKQTENMSVAVYYGTLNQLWDELDIYEPLITCTCSTDVGQKHIARRESERLHQFLLSLIKPYETLRSVILAQSPLPSVSRVFQMVSQEERVKGLYKSAASAPLPELSTFSVRPPAPRPSAQLSRSERRKLVCSNCNKSGHDRSMCFELVDEILDWWYEYRGIKNPKRSGSTRQGSGGGRSGSQNRPTDAFSKPESSNAVHTEGATSQPSDSVYDTHSHNFCGPYADGDWHG